MRESNISFIGAGNMGRSLIGGLVSAGCKPKRLYVADVSEEQRGAVRQRFGVQLCTDNPEAAVHADVLVLAVKPQALREVAKSVAETVAARRPLVLSVVAGIRESDLQRWLGGGAAIVRTMPNTPALVQSGAIALYANDQVSEEQRNLAESIMRAVGVTLWLEREEDMDAVTALSGSGPAYFFLVMEALERAAVELGLSEQPARLLTLQTAYGAAKMALESDEDVASLRARVTSPGGTTERAVRVLEQGEIRTLFRRALEAAHARSGELAEILGES